MTSDDEINIENAMHEEENRDKVLSEIEEFIHEIKLRSMDDSPSPSSRPSLTKILLNNLQLRRDCWNFHCCIFQHLYR